MLHEAQRAFEEIRKTLMEQHALTTLGLAEHNLSALDHEYDIVSEILRELYLYEKGDTLRERYARGELTGENARFVFEHGGKKYIYFRVRPRASPEELPSGGLACRVICGAPLRRIHFTCLRRCWGRRIWYGEMPPAFGFKSMSLIVLTDRPPWKRLLGKWVCSVLEWLTS